MTEKDALLLVKRYITNNYLISSLMYLCDVIDINNKEVFKHFYYGNYKGYLIKVDDLYIFVLENGNYILSIDKINLNKNIILKGEDSYDTKTKGYL